MTTINSEDKALIEQEIVLKNGNLTLYVSPWGASLRGLIADDTREIITRYTGHNKVGGEGDVLIPFPGRIREGHYNFNGSSYQMDKNDSEGPNAIHGFLRKRNWETVETTDVSATFGVKLSPDDAPGYPFPLYAEVKYELTTHGIVVDYKITNIGDKPAPVAAGFHPYFKVGRSSIDDAALTLPFKSYLQFDDDLIPTGTVLATSESIYDFTNERLIGPTKFNHCFLDPMRDSEGNVAIQLRSADGYEAVTVTLGSEIDYVVLYSGDPLPETHRRKSLAIEPMSCGSDAFNHPDWGLAAIEPGSSLTGRWSVTHTTT